MRTYYLNVNVTLSLSDEILQEARRRAEALGTSVNQLIRDYLEQFAGKGDLDSLADEFERLSRTSGGDRCGWKFDRNELHERR